MLADAEIVNLLKIGTFDIVNGFVQSPETKYNRLNSVGLIERVENNGNEMCSFWRIQMLNLRTRCLLSTALICFLALLCAGVFASAQSTDKEKTKNEEQNIETDDEVVRIDTTMVVNGVRVLDRKGRFVKGLKKKDFIITENDKPQTIESFALGDDALIPRSIVLIIDYSGSQRYYIDTSVEAAKTLVDKLNSRDRIAILTDDVKMLSSFTTDKELLKKKLDTLKTLSATKRYGASLQYTALLAALKNLFGKEDVRPIVIFQTDGDEFSWVQRKSFTFDDVLKAAEKSKVTVYSIIPGQKFIGASKKEQQRLAEYEIENPERKNSAQANYAAVNKTELPEDVVETYVKTMLAQHSALTQVAKASGGFADYIRTPDEAGAVYSRILSGINDLYVVGYYPANEARDGRRRTVKVAVRGHPEYQVSGLKTYSVPGN